MKSIKLYDLLMTISRVFDLNGISYSKHSRQVAYTSWRLAETLGLPDQEQIRVIKAGLVHDIGISSSVVRQQLFENVEIPGELSYEHSVKGSKMLSEIDCLQDIAPIIYYHHHCYDGNNPDRLGGKEIPLLAQIIHIADRVCVSIKSGYVLTQKERILEAIKRYSGTHFDPELVDSIIKLGQKSYIWLDIVSEYLESLLEERLQNELTYLDLSSVRSICVMLAHAIDDKSPYTFRHSVGVAKVAVKLATDAGMDRDDIAQIELAGLLHDIGKLAIPDAILDKPGKLTKEEMEIMKQHTYHTYRVLSKVPAFKKIAWWGGAHHEKLDGSGYPFGVNGSQLDLGCRIVAVADIFQSLNEDRPYRPALPADEIQKILQDHVSRGLIDGDVVALIENNFEEYKAIAKHPEPITTL